MHRIETASIGMVLLLAPIAACSAIDPQVGPSQESCGVSAIGTTGPSGNGGYGSSPYGGYSSSKPASSESCGIDAGSPCDDCESKYCCATRTACYADPVCTCVDQAMNTCLSSTDQMGNVPSAAANACWNAFASGGTLEAARVACERAWCPGPCAIE
jgi:hypothetical protein